MFGKNKKEMQEVEINNSSNIIGKGTSLEGNLTTSGNIRIEGKLIGSITTKSKLVLGNTSWVKGNVLAQTAEVGGEVHGTIEVGGLLILKPTAIVQGDIITNKLVFEEGARFNGKCKMSPSEQAVNTKDTSTWKGNGSLPNKKIEVELIDQHAKSQQASS
ncbi:MAG: cell shape determination protein CcmA [Candidatus Amoebophilus sp. 36-38]|nr:MAG: cell shape determination protein CcmA [Candidatus Amoebophilus sp. 36-38]